MKYISPALLVAQAIYLAFVPASIAHSIILFSLAGLFAWNQFLLSRDTPKLQTELAKLKSEFGQQMQTHKETYEQKLKDLEGEMTKVAMSHLKSPPSSSARPEPRKVVF